MLLTYRGQVICANPKFRYEAYHSVACRYGLVRVMKKSSVKCFPHLQQDIKVKGLWDFVAFLLSAASCSYLKEKWTDLWVYPFLLNLHYKKLLIFKNKRVDKKMLKWYSTGTNMICVLFLWVVQWETCISWVCGNPLGVSGSIIWAKSAELDYNSEGAFSHALIILHLPLQL